MLLSLIFFLVAFVYSMVGLGGGSAYVAFLALSGIDIQYIPATALFLNIVVTLIGFSYFKSHIQQLKNKTIILLIVLSVIGVLIGSNMRLDERGFRLALGSVLVVASIITLKKGEIHKMAIQKQRFSERLQIISVLSGFLIGLIAGLFGIGGGVFLAPVLLISGIAVKEVAAITSLFILVNSITGFISHSMQGNVNPFYLFNFALSVLLGALTGAYIGSKMIQPKILVRILTLLIFFIGVRLIWITIL